MVKIKKKVFSVSPAIWACSKGLSGSSIFTQMQAVIVRWLRKSCCSVLGTVLAVLKLWFFCITALSFINYRDPRRSKGGQVGQGDVYTGFHRNSSHFYTFCLKMETSQGLLILQRDNFLLEILQINCQVSQLSQERQWKVYW